MDLDPLREKLIESIHSNLDAVSYFENNLLNFEMLLKLCVVCAPYVKYSDDPRMETAYYISKFPAEMLVNVLPLLVVLVSIPSCEGEDMNSNIVRPLLEAIDKSKALSKSVLYLDFEKLKLDYGL